ncbi:hypothetical protein XENOCAPTIV_030171, partial [Xenoophorus captivus]
LVTDVLMRKKDLEILANLKSIVILDCNKDALYKKAVSIADKQVFAFRMVNYTGATEGDAYLDMSKVDTSVALEVGCIQVIFLNKFVSSVLVFINNFQKAKDALTEVTVQAAEKAASGVKELAERSTRIALDVHLNAPVIFLPQSSSSSNVIVADLGFLTNYVNGKFEGETQLLKPVSLDLEIQRNLSANWYHSIPDIEITAHLKPMNVGVHLLDPHDQQLRLAEFTLEQNMMVEVNYRQGLDGTNIETVVQDVYLCASMEFLLTVADVFLNAKQYGFAQVAQPKNNTGAGEKKNINSSVTSKDSSTAAAPVSKLEMTVVVRNPEILFVADLTRSDAPALVVTTHCEVSMISGAESLMTAIIKDLKVYISPRNHFICNVKINNNSGICVSFQVVACPFLREMRKNNVTTVLQPCQVYYHSSQPPGAPQAMKVEIKTLSLKAFAEAAKQTAECFQNDEAPFVVKNRLGLPVSVRYSDMFSPVGKQSSGHTVELQDGESLSMDYSVTTHSDQFSAMTSLSGKDYYIQPSKSELSLQPITEDTAEDEGMQFELSEGFSYEDIFNHDPDTRLQQTCRRRGDEFDKMMINIIPVKDTVTCKETGDIGENFDVPFVLHLWPSVLLRNLLPYPIALQSEQDEITFIVFESLNNDEEHVGDGSERKRPQLDIAVHVQYDLGQTDVAIHSPYWMVNKTGRLLQYKVDDIHRKHPLDYDMPLLYSFKPRNFLRNNKYKLMTSLLFVPLDSFRSQKEAEWEELEAEKAVYYTWTEPTGSRELRWKCGQNSGELKVCFTPNGADMHMLQPTQAPLRRHFLPGVKIQNQLQGAIFPFVFSPVKLPKYFMVLIQEMNLKLDLGFMYAILDFLTPENTGVMISEEVVSYTLTDDC